jgi:hypothetical protein
MYLALWHILPGPVWLRGIIVLALIVGVVALMAYVVYPWVAFMLNSDLGSTVQ